MKFIYLLSIVIAVAALAACSTNLRIQEIPPTANATEELKSLSKDINAAQAKQVNVLSPTHFREVKESYSDATQSLEAQKDAKQTLHEIATARAHLVLANEAAALSVSKMEEVVSARQRAITAGARESYAEDFTDTDDDLRNVTRDIESNDFDSALKDRTKLQAAYLDLELRAIKKSNLGHAKATNAKALELGAQEFAPQSLAVAEKAYLDADAYITGNRHEADQVAIRVQLANESADHLLKITKDSKKTKKVTSEQISLNMESKQNQVNLKTVDLAIERSETKGLKADKRALETESAFNAKFEEAQAQFTKSEAEVYKQGTSLIIRLRGLEFPKAQAVLRDSNFALLAKVQRVIKNFDNSSVIVEGHTDSDGSSVANNRLSQERAQAVTSYLVANDGIAQEHVKAIGYGYQKPLATNKTVEGRAQNRRVDVVIETAGSKSL